MTTTELLTKAQSNDRHSLDMFMRNYDVMIDNFAMKIANQKDVAEDISQIARVKISKSLPKFRNDCSVSSWMYRIVCNSYKDYYKKKKTLNTINMTDFLGACSVDEDSDFSEPYFVSSECVEDKVLNQIETSKIQEAVHAAIDELPESYRDIVRLRCLYDVEYEELAEMLHIPVGTVKSRLSRGKGMLGTRILSQLSKRGLEI